MKDFDRIALRNELKSLSGKSYVVILALVAILLVTILVLGLASGGLKDLKKRMDNPFTNWIDIPVTNKVHAKMDSITEYFGQSAERSKINLAAVIKYDLLYERFIHFETGDTIRQLGRLAQEDKVIVNSILNDVKHNIVCQHVTLEETPCGIIVTREMLDRLGHGGDLCSVRKIAMPMHGRRIYVDIVAVVEELPGNSDFLGTPVLKSMITIDPFVTGAIAVNSSNILPVLFKEAAEDKNLEEKIINDLNLLSIRAQDTIWLQRNRPSIIKNLVFPIGREGDYLSLNEYFTTLSGNVELYTSLYCNTSAEYNTTAYSDNLAFQFSSLEAVRAFKDLMKTKFDIDVSMEQIEAAENFALVSLLTRVMTIVLFGFALLSIAFYISSLLTGYIRKMSPNLGTLKAFGVDNGTLVRTYTLIVFIFTIVSGLVAFVIGSLVQFIVERYYDSVKLNILDIEVIVSFIIILLACIGLAWRTASRLLKYTPGDLIYERI